MNKPESVQENETQTTLWNIEIQTDHQKKKKKKRKKKNLPYSGLNRFGGAQSPHQRKRKEVRVLGPCQRAKKVLKHEGDGNINCCWYARNGPQRLRKETRRIENQKKNRDHPDYSIVEDGQNTEKSPGDPRRIAAIPVKDHQLTLVSKARKE